MLVGLIVKTDGVGQVQRRPAARIPCAVDACGVVGVVAVVVSPALSPLRLVVEDGGIVPFFAEGVAVLGRELELVVGLAELVILVDEAECAVLTEHRVLPRVAILGVVGVEVAEDVDANLLVVGLYLGLYLCCHDLTAGLCQQLLAGEGAAWTAVLP